MLELRPNCECCDRDLPPNSRSARICSYECMFCADYRLLGFCPNCGGELVRALVGPAKLLDRHPAARSSMLKPAGSEAVSA
ncbi:DUF1272 domain-containing protein [Rhodopila sp.]|uniref:DUF1272 domain-containing protein n=1 Tax=Rhodopila sp. TaxID=2480087 RepID=UPI003D0FC639